jgi:hypothetical protein
MSRLLGTLLLAAFLITGAEVHAQGVSTNVVPLELELGPQYPGPYDTVTVTPSSTVFDITAATTVLYVNGKQAGTGTGGESFSVPMQGPGVAVNIDVKASVQGASYDVTATLHPEQVSVVVEPNSTTHPFYEGMPLLASEGRARVVAVADFRTGNGTRLDPASLIYEWKLGDQVLQPQSGAGKSVLPLTGPVRYRDVPIMVTVTSPDGSYVAQRSVTLSPVDPTLRIYESDPLLGVLFNNAIDGAYQMNGEEDSFLAVPYNFTSAPALDWVVNNAESGTDPFLTVRATGSGAGSAVVSVSATGATSFDNAAAGMTISFSTGQASSGIFGQ